MYVQLKLGVLKKKINGFTTFKRNMGKTIYTKCINVDIRMYS